MQPLVSFLKELFSNKISLLGLALAIVSTIIIIVAILLSLTGIEFSLYQNIIVFAIFPIFFISGLLLIPFGVWYNRRRGIVDAGESPKPMIIDFSNIGHRQGIIFFVVMTLVISIILSVIFYQGYHYTESNQFCGTICHTVMHSEYTAYQRSPHSRVPCTECHIGSGASWFVKAKITGIWQVFAVFTGLYSRPIPTPIQDLRPARDTCEKCHWPQVFHGKRLKVFRKLDKNADIKNPITTALMLNVGGMNLKTEKYEGIHWHVSDKNRMVTYLASDEKRMQIKKVRVIDKKNGKFVEYVKKDLPEPSSETQWRVMDCIDCHNRPSHIYDIPEEAVDKALLNGKIDASLKEIRKISLLALKENYKSHEEAKTEILSQIKTFYSKNYKDIMNTKIGEIEKTAEFLFDIYKRNVFPDMKIAFNTYPDHIGHKSSPGCFRCHDEEHITSDGKEISQDCDYCHKLLIEEGHTNELSKDIKELVESIQ